MLLQNLKSQNIKRRVSCEESSARAKPANSGNGIDKVCWLIAYVLDYQLVPGTDQGWAAQITAITYASLATATVRFGITLVKRRRYCYSRGARRLAQANKGGCITRASVAGTGVSYVNQAAYFWPCAGLH
jgi:hypothetical protein